MKTDPAAALANVILALQSRNREESDCRRENRSAITFLVCGPGGKDGAGRKEKMKKAGRRGEGNSQRRGNGDRSIRAKTTGLLSESTPESSTLFSILTARQRERGREKTFGETGERQRAKAIS